MKRHKSKIHSKVNNNAVYNCMRRLWDKGYSRARIAKTLMIDIKSINRWTKNWNIRSDSEPVRKRSFDYHIAYCLLFEHGLTYKEAAFALEVKERSLRTIMNRNKAKIEETHASWIIWYTEKRKALLPKCKTKVLKTSIKRALYSRTTALKLSWSNKTEEQKLKGIKIAHKASDVAKSLKETCPHCGTTSTKAVIKRLHLDKCKQRPVCLPVEATQDALNVY